MATSDSNSSVQMQISRVAVKAPPFWRADPLLWFKQMESQFLMAGVTQDATKFHTVVASIESNILEKAAEIIVNPPSENMYDTLKNKLISSFTDSEEKRLKKLLTNIELADKKPSELLWEMRSLSQDDLNKLATMADKIADCSESEICSFSPPVNRLEEIEKKLASLCTQIESFRKSRSRSKSSSSKRSHSKSGSKAKPYCWYHLKFGENARKCVAPCTYKSSTSEN
ncbi:uncharacterized protein LOC131994044 isoform X2 [Stomoxys calcitrans]|uniref:uncharacterized protein LOC131994044 isoform X2 n=1 Tax=Stomoxys calcitrans TaxID=35570 RepID=UPI0027E330E4|nr:uncharacterized protein LOC131994044 isoform X2 [Stomoxys calcitrans]